MQSTIDIVTSFDNRVELAAMVMLHSVRRHVDRARKIRCHLLVDGISDAGAQLFEEMQDDSLRIEIHRIKSEFDDLEVRDYITRGSYLRFLIPDVLHDHDKMLYLDIDLIARRDLASLFDLSLGSLPLAAMPDHSLNSSSLTRYPWRFKYLGKPIMFSNYTEKILGVPSQGPAPYFNAGVMLLGLEEWRRRQISAKALEFLRLNPSLRFIDQDALNHVVGADYIPIDARWNACAFHAYPIRMHFLDRFDSRVRRWHEVRSQWRDEAWIAHFAGPNKPWWPTLETTPLDHLWWKEARMHPRYDVIKDAFLKDYKASGLGIDKSAWAES